ncbi:hypothetical protein QBC46DRAFT_447207 [Diplogelasinospora grovesii]|uniref:Uncharacterized protein n=1 Tax=Diplogelasinospora grovesii TaxID=303347 RepID=A0AAN6NE55_9PEZI|nr:hypothetical protein QBC46DRAFT_447207 [Diplogelasinospora grovesii]
MDQPIFVRQIISGTEGTKPYCSWSAVQPSFASLSTASHQQNSNSMAHVQTSDPPTFCGSVHLRNEQDALAYASSVYASTPTATIDGDDDDYSDTASDDSHTVWGDAMERMEEELVFWADSSIDRKCGLAGLAVVYKRDSTVSTAPLGESRESTSMLPELHAIHQALVQAVQMARSRDGKAVDVVRVFAKARHALGCINDYCGEQSKMGGKAQGRNQLRTAVLEAICARSRELENAWVRVEMHWVPAKPRRVAGVIVAGRAAKCARFLILDDGQAGAGGKQQGDGKEEEDKEEERCGADNMEKDEDWIQVENGAPVQHEFGNTCNSMYRHALTRHDDGMCW